MKNRFVIIINGGGGVGKDTFVEQCRRVSDYKIHNISTVDKIKECATILGWSGSKNEKDRKFLSDLKDLSTEYSEHPKRYITNYISKIPLTSHDIIFIHSREPKEIKWFCNNIQNCFSLLVTNPNTPIIESNHADKNVLNLDYNFYISNDGTLADLRNDAILFITELMMT